MNVMQPRPEMSHEDMVAELEHRLTKSYVIGIVRAIEKVPYHNQGYARDYAVRLANLGAFSEMIVKDITEVYGAARDHQPK